MRKGRGRRPRPAPIYGQDYEDGLTKQEMRGKAWGGASRPFLRAMMKRSPIAMRKVGECKRAMKAGELVMFRGKLYPKAQMERAKAQAKREQDELMKTYQRAMKRNRGKVRKKYTMVPATDA